MKAIVVPECLFHDAFNQAEYDFNKAIHDADDRTGASPDVRLRLADALAGVHVALRRLRDRLIETQI